GIRNLAMAPAMRPNTTHRRIPMVNLPFWLEFRTHWRDEMSRCNPRAERTPGHPSRIHRPRKLELRSWPPSRMAKDLEPVRSGRLADQKALRNRLKARCSAGQAPPRPPWETLRPAAVAAVESIARSLAERAGYALCLLPGIRAGKHARLTTMALGSR